MGAEYWDWVTLSQGPAVPESVQAKQPPNSCSVSDVESRGADVVGRGVCRATALREKYLRDCH